MSAHALLAPSSAARWLNCTGSVAAEVAAEVGDTSSSFAREGSAAHVLGERVLTYADDGRRAEFWRGETIGIEYQEDGVDKIDEYIVDDEMIDNVQVYANQVLREPGELLVEVTFDLSEVFGVPKQFGTGDAVVLDHENKRLYVGDLKYGRGVIVFAKDNDQLYSYAAGALLEYDILADWETVTVAIHQPRLHHYDEHTLSVDELRVWMLCAQKQAQFAVSLIGESPEEIELHKTAGEKQCMWCPFARDDRRGQPLCKTQALWVHETVYEGFTNLQTEPTTMKDTTTVTGEELGKILQRADAIGKWLKAIRAEATRRAQAIPGSVPGWKMVQGKMGNRKFSSDAEAEKIMKAARIKSDDMYTRKLLTFPAAEKAFAKGKPKVWTRLKALLTQAEGAPGIAPESDARPALVVADADSFGDVTGVTIDASGEDFSDLLG